MSNRQDIEVNEPGYDSWVIDKVSQQSKTLDNGLVVTVAATGNSTTLRSDWNKNTCLAGKNGQTGLRLMGDGAMAFILDDTNNTPNQTTIPMSISVTIAGFPIGHHTVAAYHIYKDVLRGEMPTIKVEAVRTDYEEETVAGEEGDVTTRKEKPVTVATQTGVKFVNVKDPVTDLKMADAAFSYVEFDIIQDGQPITFTYTTEVEEGKTYQTTCVVLNGLLIDRSPVIAMDPMPNHQDFHIDADNGSYTLQWAPATIATSHKLVIGTDEAEVAIATSYDYEGTETSYTVKGLSSNKRYYWRVDEVDAEGKIFKGNVWSFQPRHLAFPAAEGYGRFAIGGRGGEVYHVTSLSGGKEPGTLLYGLTEMAGPRYIVFDVSGIIELDFESYFTKPYAYIAGQTAPGKGVCIKKSNINIGSDVIARHIRFKRGLGTSEQTGNAMGMTGADHAIVDHCTAAWGTDETVSGRGAQNVTFQHCIITEALGMADHKNYGSGSNHGFAATIDGRIGSWHHNLLVNCAGRNWSMGGGMDATNRPIGGLDLFNNVVYNWWKRTTDGNCHKVNFVNNYYKMGPDTRRKELFVMQFELATDVADNRTNTAYIKGNIREEKNHTLTSDQKGNTYTATGYIPTDYEYMVNEPLFPSYTHIHSAEDAMKIVTSYAGATMPQRDEQHLRNVKETLEGSWTYKGSKSGIKGEIDNEADITEHAGGWENYPEEHRAADWDTDQDGMPDWWEQAVGSNPSVANQNDDPDNDGWTLLEDYLDFMAYPYVQLAPGQTGTIELKPHFEGFYGQNDNYGTVQPTYTVSSSSSLFKASVNGSTLSAVAGQNGGVGIVNVVVSDGATSWTQRFGVAVTGVASGIHDICTEVPVDDNGAPYYNLSGQRVSQPVKGIFIHNGRKVVIK
ncbi:MAG: hypothetical protein II404_03880 [Prevotella sp.]|nr:hypothetical protein [Prevotella sp.]